MQLGAPEILVLLAIALLIFGPSRIPEIGRSLGRSLVEFKQGLHSGKSPDEPGEPPQKSS